MPIVVHVTNAELRGVPFGDFAPTLRRLIGEVYQPGPVEVVVADRAEVTIDGLAESNDAAGLLELVRDITRPEVIDYYFECPRPAWRVDGLPSKGHLARLP